MEIDIKNLTESQEEEKELFVNKVDSRLVLDLNRNQILEDTDWIDMVIEVSPHLTKAFDKWMKQIVTEEEVIKMELIKKISVESIKHLSKHVNLVTDFDEETGEVLPSYLLNAYKEENFVTYENRFLYSLVKLIDDFIYLRTEAEEKNSPKYRGKNYQRAYYEGSTKINKEKIKLKFEYTSEAVEEQDKSKEIEDKIAELKKGMALIKATELYKFLDTKRFPLVKNPLKMTNVLLKNVHFQYCVKLWGYLNSHLDVQAKALKAQKAFEEKGPAKQLVDEDFFIKYLIFNSINNEKFGISERLKTTKLDDKEKRELTDKLLEKLINLNPEFSDQELKKLIAEKYVVYKNKKFASLKPLEDEFNKKIKEYLEKIGKLRIK